MTLTEQYIYKIAALEQAIDQCIPLLENFQHHTFTMSRSVKDALKACEEAKNMKCTFNPMEG